MTESTQTTTNPSEGGKQATQVNPENFVPKDQYKAELDGKATEIQTLKRSLEEAQSTLTSPEYLRFLADKRASASTSRDTTPSSPSDKETRDRLANLEVIASQLAATIELQDVERRYTDFKDYRSDVQAIINANGNLSFEQAYLMAKGKKPPSAPVAAPAKPAGDRSVTGTEKPGSFVPDSGSTEKDFKTSADASADVIRHMREKYGISDIL